MRKQTRVSGFVPTAVACAAVALAASARADSFATSVKDLFTLGDQTFLLPEPAAASFPEFADITITDGAWANQGEIDMLEPIPSRGFQAHLSDRFIFVNLFDRTEQLHAHILIGSDDEQGNLPPELDQFPLGSLPTFNIDEADPTQNPFTFDLAILADVFGPQTLNITIFSDPPEGFFQFSDGVTLRIPTPGAAALMGVGGLLVLRRRRA